MRKEKLIAAIASQRLRLESDIQPVRTALHVLDRASDVAVYVVRRLPIAGAALSVLLMVVRGRPAGILLRTAKWGLKMSRWWSRWKILTTVLPRFR